MQFDDFPIFHNDPRDKLVFAVGMHTRMRELIVTTSVTFNAVIQPLDWSGRSSSHSFLEDHGDHDREHLFASDPLLFGREVYEIFADAWPFRIAAGGGPDKEGDIDRSTACPSTSRLRH